MRSDDGGLSFLTPRSELSLAKSADSSWLILTLTEAPTSILSSKSIRRHLWLAPDLAAHIAITLIRKVPHMFPTESDEELALISGVTAVMLLSRLPGTPVAIRTYGGEVVTRSERPTHHLPCSSDFDPRKVPVVPRLRMERAARREAMNDGSPLSSEA